ncbi:hypothetical protein IG193_08690 [Infirmifilum lucidum]|uniref:Uncharacterized protein n=1 Tax=Infirmifilum lucidum TaxID=2776706 RepID=A0A7L9FG81_9CREN|nr:hypothetical protein [Infirmifilum lucidum]QOJ78810.1 hypothetical protein IG193_08690 [Infirmifilum lucidum]
MNKRYKVCRDLSLREECREPLFEVELDGRGGSLEDKRIDYRVMGP